MFSKLPAVFERSKEIYTDVSRATSLNPKALRDLFDTLKQSNYIRYLASEGIMLPNDVENLLTLLKSVYEDTYKNLGRDEEKRFKQDQAELRGRLNLLLAKLEKNLK